MEIKLYLDILFLNNFILNCIILDISNLVLHDGIHWIRRTVVAAVSTLFVCGNVLLYVRLHHIIFFQKYVHWYFTVGTIFLIAMNAVVLGDTIRKRIVLGITLYLLSCFFGGMIYSFRFFFQPSNTFAIAFTGIVADLLFRGGYFLLWGEIGCRSMICEARIYLDEKELEVKAYYDSGNQLTDPYEGRPVVIVSGKLLKRCGICWENRKILIPYYSLGKCEGMIPAISCDKLVVWKRNKKEKKEYQKVLLAIDEQLFMHRQEYEMILHNSML